MNHYYTAEKYLCIAADVNPGLHSAAAYLLSQRDIKKEILPNIETHSFFYLVDGHVERTWVDPLTFSWLKHSPCFDEKGNYLGNFMDVHPYLYLFYETLNKVGGKR